MRILHAPANIANQAWVAASGLRARGHAASVWHYGANPFSFPADRVIDEDADPARLVALLEEALDGFDAFHFHFARSLVPQTGGLPAMWDLPVLRALGKKVVFTFHGSDVRLRSVHTQSDPWSYFRYADIPCDEDRIAKQLAIIRTYADALIVAGAPLKRFVPGATYVPKAIAIEDFPMSGSRRDQRPLVVHVPSRRGTKGTDFVLKGVAQLEERGRDFEFRLAEDLPHGELRALFAEADVVVDNLLLGDCEVSSLEAMALGKPVVTRIVDEVRAAHPDVPAVSADPDSFVERIEPLLADVRVRRELGERGRAYVEANHTASALAERLEPFYLAPPSPAGRAHPDWAALGLDRRIETYEARLQTLETQAATFRATVDARNATIEDLRARLAAHERRPGARLRRLARRLLRR